MDSGLARSATKFTKSLLTLNERPGMTSIFLPRVTPLPQIQLFEKVIALVVDDDEGRKILDLDAPDRFHGGCGTLTRSLTQLIIDLSPSFATIGRLIAART
jgi:hypothetical protein